MGDRERNESEKPEKRVHAPYRFLIVSAFLVVIGILLGPFLASVGVFPPFEVSSSSGRISDGFSYSSAFAIGSIVVFLGVLGCAVASIVSGIRELSGFQREVVVVAGIVLVVLTLAVVPVGAVNVTGGFANISEYRPISLGYMLLDMIAPIPKL